MTMRPPRPARPEPPAEAPPPAADNPPLPDAAPPADAAPPPAPAESTQPAPADRQMQEMPESFRAGFPALSVDVHVYNSDPQRRFVLIGGKRYHEGDTLAEGPRIVGIVPEGIVFDWQGQRVLYAISH
jgi:general secretion pathway protein B